MRVGWVVLSIPRPSSSSARKVPSYVRAFFQAQGRKKARTQRNGSSCWVSFFILKGVLFEGGGLGMFSGQRW